MGTAPTASGILQIYRALQKHPSALGGPLTRQEARHWARIAIAHRRQWEGFLQGENL